MLKVGSALMLIGVAMLPAPAASQGRMTYCCVDSDGRQVCSDVFPKQCYGRAYREINPQGVTVKRIDAPLTAEQRVIKEAETKKAKEEEIKRMEQERRDRALLATYSNEQDIDRARDRTVADVQKNIMASQDKHAELAKLKEELDAEAEFYKKKPMPPKLKAQIRDNETDMKAQQAAIDSKLKEIEALKARYEDEKVRYMELTKTRAMGRSEAPVPAPAGAEARPR